ncbi:MAG: phage-related tail protein [Hyphomonadaceae bacterium]|nr:MAG: phage-related tail protein [Hyphomonadaceae bacterium]KAF0182678.1 MAG: phage-related tail protein [Hyphomonadaceae bacterium]
MALPQKLKNFNVHDGNHSYLGLAKEVTLPKLARKMEGYRAAGMDGEIQIDMGQEAMELEIKCGGRDAHSIKEFGALTHDAVYRRFIGAYQSDSTGLTTSVEIECRGRIQELDPGSAKPGDDTEETIKYPLSYYKRTENGKVLVEIDIANMVFNVNGVDLLAAQRAVILG